MKQQDQISFASNRLAIQKFKIVLVGDQNVGKSSVIVRYIKNDFDKTNNPTIGIDFTSKNVSVGPRTIRLQLWDTAGQERFRSLIPSYLKDCNLAIIVYDITAETTSDNIMKWIDFVREARGADALIYIVGNKIDLDQQRRADSITRVQEVANQQGITYREVSAKSAEGINELFTEITTKLLNVSSEPSSTSAGSTPKPTPGGGSQPIAPIVQNRPAEPIRLQAPERNPPPTKLCC